MRERVRVSRHPAWRPGTKVGWAANRTSCPAKGRRPSSTPRRSWKDEARDGRRRPLDADGDGKVVGPPVLERQVEAVLSAGPAGARPDPSSGGPPLSSLSGDEDRSRVRSGRRRRGSASARRRGATRSFRRRPEPLSPSSAARGRDRAHSPRPAGQREDRRRERRGRRFRGSGGALPSWRLRRSRSSRAGCPRGSGRRLPVEGGVDGPDEERDDGGEGKEQRGYPALGGDIEEGIRRLSVKATGRCFAEKRTGTRRRSRRGRNRRAAPRR